MKPSRFKRWLPLILGFLAGQTSVQLLNLMTGFFLLRWLSVEQYAQYSVALGFQSTLSMPIYLGFSGSITALVGERSSDKIGGFNGVIIKPYIAKISCQHLLPPYLQIHESVKL